MPETSSPALIMSFTPVKKIYKRAQIVYNIVAIFIEE